MQVARSSTTSILHCTRLLTWRKRHGKISHKGSHKITICCRTSQGTWTGSHGMAVTKLGHLLTATSKISCLKSGHRTNNLLARSKSSITTSLLSFGSLQLWVNKSLISRILRIRRFWKNLGTASWQVIGRSHSCGTPVRERSMLITHTMWTWPGTFHILTLMRAHWIRKLIIQLPKATWQTSTSWATTLLTQNKWNNLLFKAWLIESGTNSSKATGSMTQNSTKIRRQRCACGTSQKRRTTKQQQHLLTPDTSNLMVMKLFDSFIYLSKYI